MIDDPAAIPRPKHAYNRDNAFFGEGLARGVFLIQRCCSCGTLRNPPRPMCAECSSFEWDTVAASGRGTLYSYAIHHHPALPGIPLPCAIVLVELEEGLRTIGNLVGGGIDDLRIDLPLELAIETDADGAVRANWRPAPGGTA